MPQKKGPQYPKYRRLGRIVQFDDRSRNFKIMDLVAEKKPRSYTWRCNAWLDQGNEGACVGFGISHELISRPLEARGVDYKYAREKIYWEAQKIDPWAGGAYPGAKPFYEGTSVLCGVKVAQREGWMESYRWSFGLDEMVLGVGYNGPAVLGLNWYEDMMDTDSKGFIHPTGSLMGGHCILCQAVNVKQNFFTLHNSWGKGWGRDGDGYMTFEDMEKLLAQEGEVCFFVGRKQK